MQLCVVHQIRNSVKYLGCKSNKEFLADLKCVYAALTKDAAELALDKLEEKWDEQYPASSSTGETSGRTSAVTSSIQPPSAA